MKKSQLKVYVVKGRGAYCGGTCIVAAGGEAGALAMAQQGSSNVFNIGYDKVQELPVKYTPLRKDMADKSAVLDRSEWGE